MSSKNRTRAVTAALSLAAGLWLAASSGRAAAPKFYSDDPIWRDPESQDASGVQEVDVSLQYDLLENSFLKARATRR